jgi:hypothetical protein
MAPIWFLAIIFGLFGLRKIYYRGRSIVGIILGLLAIIYKIGFWIVAAGGILAAIYSLSGNSSTPNYTKPPSELEKSIRDFQKDAYLNWTSSLGGTHSEIDLMDDGVKEHKKPTMEIVNLETKSNGIGDLLTFELDSYTSDKFQGKVLTSNEKESKKWVNQTITIEKKDDKTLVVAIGSDQITLSHP